MKKKTATRKNKQIIINKNDEKQTDKRKDKL